MIFGGGSPNIQYPRGELVHASVRYIDPDLSTTSAGKWSSKNGVYQLMTHARNQIAGGDVPKYYGQIQFSLKVKNTFKIPENTPSLINEEKTIYSDLQIKYLTNQIEVINPVVRKKFLKAYTEWEASYLKNYGHSSNTYHSSKVEEFKALIQLGKEMAPLLIAKMLYGDNFVSLVPYESIYDNDISSVVLNVDWIPEQIRAIKTVTKWFHNSLSQELTTKITMYMGGGKSFLSFDPNTAIKFLSNELKK